MGSLQFTPWQEAEVGNDRISFDTFLLYLEKTHERARQEIDKTLT